MDRKLLELQIEHLLQNINFRLDVITRQDEKISRLDLEGLKDKVRELYDQVLMLEKYSLEKIRKVSNLYEPETKDIPPASVKGQKGESEEFERGRTSHKTPPVPRPDERDERKVDKENMAKESKQRPDEIPYEDKKRNIDVIHENKTTVADKFLQEDDKSVAARIKKNPIDDMKLAIGVNDKFLFIKELFGGNIQEYSEAIEKLNSFQTFDEAMEYLKSLAGKYKWEDDSEHYLRLSEIVERKYL